MQILLSAASWTVKTLLEKTMTWPSYAQPRGSRGTALGSCEVNSPGSVRHDDVTKGSEKSPGSTKVAPCKEDRYDGSNTGSIPTGLEALGHVGKTTSQ